MHVPYGNMLTAIAVRIANSSPDYIVFQNIHNNLQSWTNANHITKPRL